LAGLVPAIHDYLPVDRGCSEETSPAKEGIGFSSFMVKALK
jgi:hypothetical protein